MSAAEKPKAKELQLVLSGLQILERRLQKVKEHCMEEKIGWSVVNKQMEELEKKSVIYKSQAADTQLEEDPRDKDESWKPIN